MNGFHIETHKIDFLPKSCTRTLAKVNGLDWGFRAWAWAHGRRDIIRCEQEHKRYSVFGTHFKIQIVRRSEN